MERLISQIPDSPLISFTILLLVTLTIPPIFERLRLPGLVGLLVAGICLGPEGLRLLSADSETMSLLSDIGKIYLMFVAGLEIDLAEFRKTKNRSLGFGIATFLIPLAIGTLVGIIFSMGLNSSILIGSLMASHTLLGYPIITRLGVAKSEAVTVSVGATIFTDIAALLVLAICISIHAGEFSPASLVIQLGALALYATIVLFGFDWAGKEYFRRTGDEESNQFLFVLLAVFLASVGSQIINVDKIVGAFLAGLAVNDVLQHSPVEEKVVFVGSTLFIPFFFVDMGLILNISGLISTLSTQLLLTLAIVGGLITAKFLAAFVTKLLYRYNWNEMGTMWSLSLPQVAATLAAALAAVEAGLLPDTIFNAVIVLMLVTAILGPVLTDRFARHLPLPVGDLEADAWAADDLFDGYSGTTDLERSHHPFTVVIPVNNPNTERYLIELGTLLARHESGIVIPLAIAKSHVHMDEPRVTDSLQQSRRLLKRAIMVSQEFGVEASPLVRIDDDVAHGISRAAREYDASLIVMGWSAKQGIQARLFGNITDSVFWSSHCPVAVVRLVDEPINIRRILVPIKSITPQAIHPVRLAQLLADMNQATVTLLHVCDRHTSIESATEFETELASVVHHTKVAGNIEIQTIRDSDVAHGIIKVARDYDMVILRSMRRRTAGGLAVSDVTTQVIAELSCSLVMLGEPHTGTRT
jgi:Kef-type K+ transport system membrane component KefB/nucleotide-binding universal stress UspA family protein